MSGLASGLTLIGSGPLYNSLVNCKFLALALLVLKTVSWASFLQSNEDQYFHLILDYKRDLYRLTMPRKLLEEIDEFQTNSFPYRFFFSINTGAIVARLMRKIAESVRRWCTNLNNS